MGKTADLTVVQKTTIDTLHKEGKTQNMIILSDGADVCGLPSAAWCVFPFVCFIMFYVCYSTKCFVTFNV